MKTTITRSILTYVNSIARQAGILHVAALQRDTDTRRKRATKAYKRAELLADVAAIAYEQAEEADAKTQEIARANEAEALRILERG